MSQHESGTIVSAPYLTLYGVFENRISVQIDDPTPPEQLKCTVNTFVRPLDQFPPNFERQAKNNSKGSIMPMKNERMLLSSLLSKVLAIMMLFIV